MTNEDDLDPLPSLEEAILKVDRFELLCDEIFLKDEEFYDSILDTLEYAAPVLFFSDDNDDDDDVDDDDGDGYCKGDNR